MSRRVPPAGLDAGMRAGNASKTWSTSSLPRLSPEGLSALLDLMPSLIGGHGWTVTGSDDEAVIWEYADRHGLSGIPAAPPMTIHGASPKLLEDAERRYMSNMLRYEQARNACRRIQDVAEPRGIPFFCAKGAALVADGYGDTGIRSFEDIDGFVPSREAGLALVAALGIDLEEDVDAGNLYGRIRDPGKLKITIESLPMEIRYPVQSVRTPFFDLFREFGFPPIRHAPGGIAVPPAEWHFVLLLLHMSHHHLFARLVWFLDLVVLVNRHGETFDWDWVHRALARLNMRSAGAIVGDFCRRHIDPTFPVFEAVPGAWNVDFMRYITRPDVIVNGTFDKHHRSRRKQCYAYIAAIVHHFIIADPAVTGRGWRGQAGTWVTGRACAPFLSMGFVGRATAVALKAVLAPMAYATARLLGKYTLAVTNEIG